jgi:translation initiation factor 2B subunit (eIF-2B alpha/beta/delta family)
MKTTSFDFAEFVVVLNGSVDVEATVEKFQEQLEAYVTANVNVDDKIYTAVNRLFDRHPKTLSMSFVINAILSALDMNPENCKKLTKKAQEFIRMNSSKDRDAAMLKVVVGRGGGVARWADVPEEDETK